MAQPAPLPTQEAVMQADEVARTSIKAAQYLFQQFAKKIEPANKNGELDGALSAVAERTMIVAFTLSRNSANSWKGSEVKSDFMNLQDNLAAVSAHALGGISDKAVMRFAIGPGSEFVRGFGGSIDNANLAENMENLFNAWLAQNNIVSQNGVLCEADGNGSIMQDIDGKPKLADKEKVLSLMNSNGFVNFLNKLGINVEVELKQEPFSKQVEAATVQPEAEAVQVTPEKPAVVAEVSPEEPEGPDTGPNKSGGGMGH